MNLAARLKMEDFPRNSSRNWSGIQTNLSSAKRGNLTPVPLAKIQRSVSTRREAVHIIGLSVEVTSLSTLESDWTLPSFPCLEIESMLVYRALDSFFSMNLATSFLLDYRDWSVISICARRAARKSALETLQTVSVKIPFFLVHSFCCVPLLNNSDIFRSNRTRLEDHKKIITRNWHFYPFPITVLSSIIRRLVIFRSQSFVQVTARKEKRREIRNKDFGRNFWEAVHGHQQQLESLDRRIDRCWTFFRPLLFVFELWLW